MFLHPFRLAYLSTSFMLSALGGSLVITPPRLVVEYGGRASAVCSTNITLEAMAWEASQGAVEMTFGVQQLTWEVQKVTQWDIKPLCYINVDKNGTQEREFLPVTIYKFPEKLSISLVNHTGPLIEGEIYWLQCNIQKVAPVQNVIVNWYKEQTLVKRDNETSTLTAKVPQNKATMLQISPSRFDDGAQYRCESELDLGAEGPRPPLRNTSGPVSITVHYKPQFLNPVEVLMDHGAPITLDCTVKANPPAVYQWDSAQQVANANTAVITLSSSSLGNHTCTATNRYGSNRKVFTIKSKPSRAVFWILLGTGLGLALGLVAGYVLCVWVFKGGNSVI